VYPTTWAVDGWTLWASCCAVCFGYCKNVLSVAVDAIGERLHEIGGVKRSWFLCKLLMRHSLGNTCKKYDSIQDSPCSVESVACPPPSPNPKQKSDNFVATFRFHQPPNH
jgi:hypothetical protein